MTNYTITNPTPERIFAGATQIFCSIFVIKSWFSSNITCTLDSTSSPFPTLLKFCFMMVCNGRDFSQAIKYLTAQKKWLIELSRNSLNWENDKKNLVGREKCGNFQCDHDEKPWMNLFYLTIALWIEFSSQESRKWDWLKCSDRR